MAAYRVGRIWLNEPKRKKLPDGFIEIIFSIFSKRGVAMEQTKIDNRQFYTQLLAIGAPVILQNFIQAMVSLLDVFMIGQLGEAEITAVSMGNSWINLLFFLFNGITAAGGVFVAQYWGKKDLKSIHNYIGLMVVLNVTASVLFAAFSALCSDWIITLYSADPQVIELGSSYIRIMSVYCVLLAFVNVCAVALSNTEQTVLPMQGSILSLTVNLVLNYLLIFGHFGLPKLGVKGAAIATVIALFVQMLFLYSRTFYKKYPICASWKDYFSLSKEQWKKYFSYGAFLIVCEVIFAVGQNVYNIGYKYTGTSGQAALQIMNNFQQLSLILAMGLGTASAIMLGKLLGENKLDLVKAYSRRFLVLIPAVATVLGIIVFFCSPLLLSIFKVDATTMEYAEKLMIMLVITIPLKTVNFVIVAGILRSGGDSKYCFLCNFVGNWVVGIPMVFLGAVALGLPIHWVYLMVTLGEVAKLGVGLPRTLSYKWVKNIT